MRHHPTKSGREKSAHTQSLPAKKCRQNRATQSSTRYRFRAPAPAWLHFLIDSLAKGFARFVKLQTLANLFRQLILAICRAQADGFLRPFHCFVEFTRFS